MKNSKWQPALPPSRTYKTENLKELLKVSQFIYQVGEDDRLREKAKRVPVAAITASEMKAKIAYLKRCMRQYKRMTKGKGRGMAAVQVGIPEAFFLVYMPEEPGKIKVFINPKITKKSKTLLRYREACMSANSLVAPVVRPAWIEFDYDDETGKRQTWQIKDTDEKGRMDNRIVQHEIDHLFGIINIDRVRSRSLCFESGRPNDEKAQFETVSAKVS